MPSSGLLSGPVLAESERGICAVRAGSTKWVCRFPAWGATQPMAEMPATGAANKVECASSQRTARKGWIVGGGRRTEEDFSMASERKGRGRGFASMDPQKQREIASKGGRAAHIQHTAHEWDSEEAPETRRPHRAPKPNRVNPG